MRLAYFTYVLQLANDMQAFSVLVNFKFKLRCLYQNILKQNRVLSLLLIFLFYFFFTECVAFGSTIY